ncbi:hypothetical protein QYM36_002378 [Artemia franciscana]|uniref:Uncharacterized protein n=1 Tax=Artemia franciscana TaxID=6661 RepID=A0AA88I7A8_ARTSF|nr:hypothetical protein QYM36_002378 [Artemia franciscana]
METPILLGITDVKQEAQDTSSNEDKDIFGSTQPMLLMKHEAKFFAISPGISGNCQHNAKHVKLESSIDGNEVLLLAASSDNDRSEQERGLISMPGLSSLCLKKEMNSNCQIEMPSHIYLIEENDVGKQEASHALKDPFECDIVPVYLVIIKLILEKNLSNVMYVRNVLQEVLVYLVTKELILEKNPLGVMYVGKSLLQVPIYLFIEELILEEDLSNTKNESDDPIDNSDHAAILTELRLATTQPLAKQHKFIDYKPISERLADLDWDTIVTKNHGIKNQKDIKNLGRNSKPF